VAYFFLSKLQCGRASGFSTNQSQTRFPLICFRPSPLGTSAEKYEIGANSVHNDCKFNPAVSRQVGANGLRPSHDLAMSEICRERDLKALSGACFMLESVLIIP
jgi:hypothetical protein